ncbi:hypothetical protein DAI22_04g279600 [Oryza sativa Japonica Group]|nr:hypothetical protein DAI22_04g279600 [Oryza sativa Japonica Group]
MHLHLIKLTPSLFCLRVCCAKPAIKSLATPVREPLGDQRGRGSGLLPPGLLSSIQV